MNGPFTSGSCGRRDDEPMFNVTLEILMAQHPITLTRAAGQHGEATARRRPAQALRALGIAGLLAAAPWLAMAQATPAAPAVTANANATTMDMPRLIQHVASLGYHDIDEVERKGDRLYEVKARDPKGQWVEITVDGRSGEVLRSEREHDRRR